MTVTLGEICVFNYGEALPEENRISGDVPVYGSNGVVGWHDRAITQGPTVVIGRKGSIGQVHYSGIPCYPIDTTYYVDSTKAPCDMTWLYYMLKALDLTKLNKSAAVPGLNRDDAYRTCIPFAPLAEQRRIAAILRAADDERRRRRYTQALSDELLGEVFVRMFGDPATNPMGWGTCLVEHLLSPTRKGIQTGPFGSALKRHEYVDAGIPVWGIDNVTEYGFRATGSLYITSQKYQELVSYRVEDGDVLISRAGTVGRMCVAHPPTDPSIIGTNLVRVSLDQTRILPDYFIAFFAGLAGQNAQLRASSDEGAYSFMNPESLRATSIVVPSIQAQWEFVHIKAAHERIRRQQQESARQSDHLFDTLLHRAFAGEL